MPNWCSCNITIERNDIGKKQFKKLYKRLIKSDNAFDAIINIDYSTLFKLDKLNSHLANNEESVELLDYILSFLCEKDNLEIVTTKDIMKDMYKRIRKGKFLNLYTMDNNLKNISNSLYDHYKYIMMKNEPKEYNDDSEFTFSKLFPDNPVAFIRSDYLKEKSFLDLEDIKIDTRTDDWYNDRIYNRYGTKWDASESSITYDDNVINIITECAWSPCEIFCSNLVELYDVKVTVQFEECGCGFMGITKFYSDDDNDVQTEEVYYNDSFEDDFDFEYTRLLLDSDFNIRVEDIIQLLYDCISAELIEDFEEFDIDEILDNDLEKVINNNKKFRKKLISFLKRKTYLDCSDEIKKCIKYIKSLVIKPKDLKTIKIKKLK